MGGSFALLLARTGLYKVSAPFYNTPVDVPRACPVVASYGGRDLMVRGVASKLESQLDALGVPNDVKVYPEMGHSFYTETPGLVGEIAKRSPIHGEYHEPAPGTRARGSSAFFGEHL